MDQDSVQIRFGTNLISRGRRPSHWSEPSHMFLSVLFRVCTEIRTSQTWTRKTRSGWNDTRGLLKEGSATQGRYEKSHGTSHSFTTPRWGRDEHGLHEAPPHKAGSRSALHTHPPGRPNNDMLIWICSYTPRNSRWACKHAHPVHLCEPEVPQDLDCKSSISPMVLLYMRPYLPFRHQVRVQHRLCQAKLQIPAFSSQILHADGYTAFEIEMQH